MISEAVLGLLLVPVNALIGGWVFSLPVATLPAEFIGGVVELLGYVGWILPLSALLPIFIIKIALLIFNIGWKTILRIKSFIPTLGD